MKNLYRFITIALLAAFAVGCSSSSADAVELQTTDTLDYSSDDLWFELSSTSDKAVDVFYILPTCVWDWEDDNGEICHYASVDASNTEQREAMQGSYELAREIFAGDDCNYFAPYYRHISLNSWMEGEQTVAERFPFAFQDIEAAFNEFLASKNDGRPFVLAGFSQGGKGVVELLKIMQPEVYERMVAAYVVGYRVSEDELNNYSTIVAASGAADTGVTICYNSVESIESICNVLSPSALCINPLNWCTDATPAALYDSATVRVDTENKVLLVEGLDSEQYYISALGDLFPLGNYHLQELYFYSQALRENVAQRIASFD